jgi:hypothetical protein
MRLVSIPQFLPHLSPALAALLFPLWLVYRLIRPSQDAFLRERAERKRREGAIVSCVAYVGLFLAASLILMLVILLMYRLTAPERQAPKAVPQEPHWNVTQVSLRDDNPIVPGTFWVYSVRRHRADHPAGQAAVAVPAVWYGRGS